MDRWSLRWNHIWVDRQMSHVTDIWIDLSCYRWYDRQTHLGIDLSHACDLTSPLNTKVLAIVHVRKYFVLYICWDILGSIPNGYVFRYNGQEIMDIDQ